MDVLAGGNHQGEGILKTYTFAERRIEKPGPWENEPDKAQWIDGDTDLDCLMVRNPVGALCGYVGVQPGHPWHGKDYDAVEPYPEVHGGLTFASFCQEGAEDGPGVCHVPAPGRPANVWWLGFDCAHIHDIAPKYDDVGELPTALSDGFMSQTFGEPFKTYKTFEYVQQECAGLAKQIKAAG